MCQNKQELIICLLYSQFASLRTYSLVYYHTTLQFHILLIHQEQEDRKYPLNLSQLNTNLHENNGDNLQNIQSSLKQ